MAPKKKTLVTSKKDRNDTVKEQPKPIAKSLKRKAVEKEVEESDSEEFGNVNIDMGSSDEEEDNNEENDEDEETEAFPEISLSDDEEDDEDFQADSEELEDEDSEAEDVEEIEDEDMDDDDDELVEEDLDEELERELEKEKLEDEAEEESDDFKIPAPYRQHYDKEKLPEIEANYESDSSTEETENTIGNVPLEWYKDLPHIGYDIDGKKILKPATADELDKFLATMEDPDSWKTVKSDKEGKDIVLNDEELDIIQRLQRGIIPDSTYDPYEPTVEWFTSKTETMPLSARPEPKRRFVPSKWEARKIMKIVRAIRQGRIIPRKPKDEKPRFYNLWGDDDTPREDHIMHVAAPKMKLPEHDESYNPPAEYLPDENEIKEWNEMDEEDRPKNYLPKKYNTLRHVPAYDKFIQERFQRCLDLYLAPRVRKNRLNIDPESLIPKLPSPKDLRPFPTHQSISYEGHTARIRALSIHPNGLYALSGSDDNTCRLWEVLTGRCLMMWKFDAVIHAISWCPNPDVWLFGISVGHGEVHLISPPKLCSAEQALTTDQFTKSGFATSTDESDAKQTVSWIKPSEADEEKYGYKVRIQHTQVVKQITWHRKGDYVATVSPDAKNLAVLIHQVTKHQTQSPFRRLKGLVQKVAFHPIKPIFFVATQIYVRIYDLMQQQLIKTLQTSVKWVSSIDIHPGGDNVIIGSYDKKVCWFDLDLSSRPYKSLRYHTKAVRQVSFHKRYPLFASSSDDGTIQIFYGMVYNDLLQNPLIVPVKILRGHDVKDGLGVLNIEFHPTQPWIFSTGADGTFRLWT
ncbi:NUC169 domain-containing protein [Cokeromyces recurvatus]|uniref:NUC169 domain-containing protein n=1 Tax=Cokeromyces recurvatus TaxID=90255 RepID=UPI0022202907|nr:NUC169 domain-containing protein [Cokeromyces recurvatus]KAI7900427.1 NUC169 domain-containing protein [Cokeromyces recurvatus]